MTLTRVSNAIYWLFLSLWFGGLVMSGVVAGFAFPKLKSLGVTVPDFKAMPPEEHFKIAAGSILYEVFFVTDFIQLLSVIVVMMIVGLQIFSRKITLPRVPNLIRLAALTVVLVTLCYHLFLLAPRMNGNLVKYWELAKTGGDYLPFQQAFEAEHPTARMVLTVDVLGLLVVILASGFMLVPGRDEDAGVVQVTSSGGNGDGPGLEEPALLKKQ